MDNGETIWSATDYFRPFPDPHDVFASKVDEHSKYLLPIGTLDLRRISADWTGAVHFILPIEPVGGHGVLGERSAAYNNYLCRPNWLAYSYRGNKCELACDFRFFHKPYYAEHPPDSEVEESEAVKLSAHYDCVRDHFSACARHFNEHGWLCADPDNWDPNEYPPELLRRSFVQSVGGVSYESNWSAAYDERFPLSRYPAQYEDRGELFDCDRVLPRTEDGRDFVYVGQSEMWNFIGCTNGILLLFFDPLERVALTTIDW